MAEFKRIECSDITDTLAKAMEHAGQMRHCVVFYECDEDSDHSGGFFVAGQETTLANLNFMIDRFKLWLFRGE